MHLGHVALVVALTEKHHLDLVLVIPAQINPHKNPPTSAVHRLHMVKEAFQNVPTVQVLTLELEREGPSYTIDTVHELYKRGIVAKSDSLFLLLGEDQLQSIATWKNVQELFTLAPPLIASRNLAHPPCNFPASLQKSIEQGITVTPCFDISATDIRERLKKRLFCGHLLDIRVYNYIQRHHLYE